MHSNWSLTQMGDVLFVPPLAGKVRNNNRSLAVVGPSSRLAKGTLAEQLFRCRARDVTITEGTTSLYSAVVVRIGL